jgi:hypothetical protein
MERGPPDIASGKFGAKHMNFLHNSLISMLVVITIAMMFAMALADASMLGLI